MPLLGAVAEEVAVGATEEERPPPSAVAQLPLRLSDELRRWSNGEDPSLPLRGAADKNPPLLLSGAVDTAAAALSAASAASSAASHSATIAAVSRRCRSPWRHSTVLISRAALR